MARYRKIDPRIWKDEKFRHLSAQEKLICVYGFTAQSNRIGIFSFSPGEAAEDLETSTQTFQKGFGNVINSLHWMWDPAVRVLYIPTWWKYNCPENPNVLKGCLGDVHDVPQTPLYSAFYYNLVYLPETFHETFTQTLAKPLGNQSPIQEQEQEQENKQEQEGDGAGALHAPEFVLLTFGEFGRVRLTEDQHAKLKSKLNGNLDSYIARFDRWVNEAPEAKASGIRRKDRHSYESILSWFDRDVKEGKVQRPVQSRTEPTEAERAAVREQMRKDGIIR